jgi:hypothetical protein
MKSRWTVARGCFVAAMVALAAFMFWSLLSGSSKGRPAPAAPPSPRDIAQRSFDDTKLKLAKEMTRSHLLSAIFSGFSLQFVGYDDAGNATYRGKDRIGEIRVTTDAGGMILVATVDGTTATRKEPAESRVADALPAPLMPYGARHVGEDDAGRIIKIFGPADKDWTTLHDSPRPKAFTRFMLYAKEHVQMIFVPNDLDATSRSPGPFNAWRVLGYGDDRDDRKLAIDEVMTRMAKKQ